MQPTTTDPNEAVISDLRHSLAWMELVLSNLQEGVMVIGKDRRIIFVNNAISELVGKPRVLLLGIFPWQIMQILLPGQDPHTAKRTLSFKRLCSFNGLYEVRVGSTQRTVEITTVPLASFNQAVLMFRDITERETQDYVRQAYLENTIQSSQDAIYTVGLDGIITTWNRGAEKTYGYSKSEIVGQSIFTLVPTDLYNEQSWILEYVQKGMSAHQRELIRRKKNGRLFNVSVSISPLRDPRGRLIGSTIISRDITEQKRTEERIRHQLNHDPLTGLPNRLLLYEQFNLYLAQAHRQGHMVGVIFLDLDNFKQVNDNLGHAAGDTFLREVGKRIRRCLRKEDTVARFAGDEFIILLPEIRDPVIIHDLAQKILNATSRELTLAGKPIQIQASLGIALYPQDGQDPDSLIKRADKALYRVKREGKNDYRFSGEHAAR